MTALSPGLNRRRVIAVDCDDVIVATAPAILRHYNNEYGTNIELKDFYSKDLSIWDAPDYETAVQRVETFLATSEYHALQPLKEAVEAMQILKEHHELHIVTGRPDFLADATQAMLRRHFADVFKSVEFTNFFGQKARPKAQVCSDLGADLLIDDHLHHAMTVADCGIEVFLFGDYPWNVCDDLPPRILRTKDWKEVVQLLVPSAK